MGKRGMNKRALIKELSESTQLSKDAVTDVMDAFIDIFIRECVLTGKFNLHNAFSVESHTRAARKQYNVNTKKYFDYPETEVLSIKLSPKINSFKRWSQRNARNYRTGLTPEDWRKLKK